MALVEKKSCFWPISCFWICYSLKFCKIFAVIWPVLLRLSWHKSVTN